jgi:DNA-binding helix-hairpin-helix protein with protein kinase domain
MPPKPAPTPPRPPFDKNPVTRLFSGAGHPVEPGKTLGRGGEGAVHEIAGRPGFVAKIYHQPVDADKALKLAGMARQAHPALLEVAAWPVDVLHAGPRGPVQGFVMPRVSGYQEIHSLYGPSHRKRAFPHADWSFLVHAARNLASAFEAIHARGHVIGDVNPGNVVVSAQALVKLIDCDSFQIDTGDRLFLCDVGVPQFTAPELQDRPFRGLRRTPDHDAFGLALLCFHLLFMGRHPFAGRFRGKGDMPIERAIREYRFAFGHSAAAWQMEPPPHTLPFAALPRPVADLFERAFVPLAPARNRPTAREWLLALEQLNRQLRACGRNVAHKYPGPLPDCPWCALEQSSGTIFFISPHPPPAARPIPAHRAFDLDQAWSRIVAVAPPAPEAMPRPASQTPVASTPLPDPLQRIQRRNLIKAGAIAGAVLTALLIHPRLGWLWLLLAAAIGSLLWDKAVHREYQRRRLALVAARRELMDLRATWQRHATEQAFVSRLHALQNLRDRHRNLLADFQRDAQRLETDRRQTQLQAFLESHFIDAARIPGIRATDQIALESYGIETAADLTPEALRAVPGFGQRLGRPRMAALLAWRRSLERRFRYDPHQGANPAAIADLGQQYARQRSRIEGELLAGPDELATIKEDILKQRARLNIALIRQAIREAQAQADLRVFYPGPGALWRR